MRRPSRTVGQGSIPGGANTMIVEPCSNHPISSPLRSGTSQGMTFGPRYLRCSCTSRNLRRMLATRMAATRGSRRKGRDGSALSRRSDVAIVSSSAGKLLWLTLMPMPMTAWRSIAGLGDDGTEGARWAEVSMRIPPHLRPLSSRSFGQRMSISSRTRKPATDAMADCTAMATLSESRSALCRGIAGATSADM